MATADSSPAQDVLEHFLDEALDSSIEEGSQAREERELRIDILYLLTDESAHRRALPLRSLVGKIRQVQAPGRTVESISEARIRAALTALGRQRLVRGFDAPGDTHYELAHDFLVRSVVRHYQVLYRERIAALALQQRRRQVADAEIERLTSVERWIHRWLLILPVVTLALAFAFLAVELEWVEPFSRRLLSLYFPCLLMMSFALVVLGVTSRCASAIGLGIANLIFVSSIILAFSADRYSFFGVLARSSWPLLLFAILELLVCPAILGFALDQSSWRASVQRIWAELLDVGVALLFVVILHPPEAYMQFLRYPSEVELWFSDFWWHPLPGLAAYVVVSTVLLKFTGATPGNFIARIRTTDGTGARPGIVRALARQVLQALLTYGNIFGGIPSLVLTPIWVAANPSHQLFYDSLLGLKTEPTRQPGTHEETPPVSPSSPPPEQHQSSLMQPGSGPFMRQPGTAAGSQAK